MKKYIKTNSHSFEELYDKKFGIPNTNVYNVDSFFNYLSDVINFDADEDEDTDEIHSSENLRVGKVDKIVATKVFERSVKELKKKHKTKVLREIYDTVLKLSNYEIETQKDNHKLKDFKGHYDIHFEGKRLILLYRYVDEETLIVSLKLQDIVNHKELKRYDKFTDDVEEYDVENLIKSKK